MIAIPDPILECARLAAVTGAPPIQVAIAAIAAMRAASVREVADRLASYGEEIDRLVEGGTAEARAPAPLEPELRFDPEIGRARPDFGDHEIRDKRLFRDLVPAQGFFQVAAWSIGGVALSADDADLLDRSGVLTQLLAPEIWPLALTRRIAARGGGLGASLLGGVAALCTPRLAGLPVAGFMRFLDRVDRGVVSGATVDEIVAAALRAGERIPGFGRPVLGPDERVPRQLELYARRGRADGPSVRLAQEIDRAASAVKGIRLNSAGMHGALMRDLGFSPDAAAAFSTIYFIVPVLAHAVFAGERARGRGAMGG